MGIISTGCREKLTLFAGGFTEKNDKGLSLFEFNPGNGNLKLVSENVAGPNPSFFCFSEDQKLIYVLNEVMEFNGNPGCGITTMQYNPSNGEVKKKGEILVPYGGGCHISISADNRFLFVANYSSSSVAVVKLDKNGIPETVTDTILYEEKARDVSHPHMISYDPKGRHVYLTDLGLDRIVIYNFDNETGKLSLIPNRIVPFPEGAGPRHFMFNEDGSNMYVINELNSTIIVFNVDNAGYLNAIQTVSTVKEGFAGTNYCAEILPGKDGKFLYGSNRGDNSIVTFKISDEGTLSLVGHVSCGGDWPRNFVIDPTGRYLLSGNERSGNISVLKIDQKTGIPKPLPGNTLMAGPACLEFLKIK